MASEAADEEESGSATSKTSMQSLCFLIVSVGSDINLAESL